MEKGKAYRAWWDKEDLLIKICIPGLPRNLVLQFEGSFTNTDIEKSDLLPAAERLAIGCMLLDEKRDRLVANRVADRLTGDDEDGS